jgi:Zn-dependent protease with chaperone function
MSGFFYNLGRMIGPNLRKVNWMVRSVSGSEEEAAAAERAVGRDLAQAYLQQMEVDANPAGQRLLDELTGQLAQCFKRPLYQFEARIIHAAEPNALALPGGFIFVMRPLLDFCQWDRDEIAFVLAHEMSHIACRHAIERLMAGSLIQTSLRRVPTVAVLAQVATSLLQQGYSQDQELEADNFGVRLMHTAGFDPAAAIRALSRLGTLPPEAWLASTYFSSHPPLALRIERLRVSIGKIGRG